MTYIALLRGINVGSHVVKMDYLRQLFMELGFTNVRSYIQSGNIFFESSNPNKEELITKIEEHLKNRLGYSVSTCLRSITELEQVLALDPFQAIPDSPELRFCVLFTSEVMPMDLRLPTVSPKKDLDIIAITPNEAYVVWHIINGRPPASTFLDKTLGVQATSRFFHTLKKILDAAKKDAN